MIAPIRAHLQLSSERPHSTSLWSNHKLTSFDSSYLPFPDSFTPRCIRLTFWLYCFADFYFLFHVLRKLLHLPVFLSLPVSFLRPSFTLFFHPFSLSSFHPSFLCPSCHSNPSLRAALSSFTQSFLLSSCFHIVFGFFSLPIVYLFPSSLTVVLCLPLSCVCCFTLLSSGPVNLQTSWPSTRVLPSAHIMMCAVWAHASADAWNAYYLL